MSNDQAADRAEGMAEGFEGFSATPYQDPVGVWTIGYGSTRDIGGNPVSGATLAVTAEGARQLLLRDMRSAMQAVEGDVKVPLSTDEEAALIDFTYNLGAGALRASTLLRLLNAGDYAGAAGQFDLWDHAGGRVLAGLLRRRAAEKAMFQRGMLADAAPSVPAVPAPAPAPTVSPAPPAADPAPGGVLGWFSSLFS